MGWADAAVDQEKGFLGDSANRAAAAAAYLASVPRATMEVA